MTDVAQPRPPKAAITAIFRPTVRSIARENASVVLSHGTRRSRRRHLAGGPDGRGQPVLLLPGFMSGDWSMTPMAKALKTWHFAPARSGIRLNIQCTMELVERLELRLEQLAVRFERPVAIVGWSRGGTLGKMLTIRRPELVSGLVTLASPNVNPLAVNTHVARQVGWVTKLSDAGWIDGMREDCVFGDCAAKVGEGLAADFPKQISYISVYTPLDGVVDWRACLDPDARLIEVQATHLGIGNKAHVQRLVGNELAAMIQ